LLEIKEGCCLRIWFNDGAVVVFGTRNTPDLCLRGWGTVRERRSVYLQ